MTQHNEAILNGNPVTGWTSGSTGIPVRVAVSPQLGRARAEDVKRFVGWLGGPLPVARLVYTRNEPPEGTFPVTAPTDDQIDFILKRRTEANIQAVTTLPTNALILCDRMAERGLEMPFVTRFGLYGEAVDQTHREAIARAFPNARIWTTYSSEEFGLIAAECPHNPDHHHYMAHRLGVELLDLERDEPAAPGSTGRLVITDYLNRRSPLIRFALGDLATVGECPCGQIKLPSFGRVLGKTRGFLRHRDGSRVAFVELSVMLRDIPGVRQYQVHQRSLEEFEIRIVGDRWVDLEVGAALQAHFGYLPNDVTVTYRDAIPVGSTGKFQHAICEV